MADQAKTLRHLLVATVHRAVVTRVEVDALDAVVVDGELLDAAGLLENEKVELTNLTSGARLSLAVRRSEPHGAEVAVLGPAAHLMKPGDLVSVSAFGWFKDKAARKHQPTIVRVDELNRPVEVTGPRRERVKPAKAPEPSRPEKKAKKKRDKDKKQPKPAS
jgi:aspartate 1-decarboxylase